MYQEIMFLHTMMGYMSMSDITEGDSSCGQDDLDQGQDSIFTAILVHVFKESNSHGRRSYENPCISKDANKRIHSKQSLAQLDNNRLTLTIPINTNRVQLFNTMGHSVEEQ
ncbi:unnamed protein product, partial [Meganyctiphanes norvegica]